MIRDTLVLPSFEDRFRILRSDEPHFLSSRVSDYVSRSGERELVSRVPIREY